MKTVLNIPVMVLNVCCISEDYNVRVSNEFLKPINQVSYTSRWTELKQRI